MLLHTLKLNDYFLIEALEYDGFAQMIDRFVLEG